jgi:hypothetical protein
MGHPSRVGHVGRLGWKVSTNAFREAPFDPAQIEAMRSAFHKVCDALMLRCDGDDPMTEIIVTKIVALAKAGEHDASRLVELVLNDLADDGLPAAS